MSHEKQGITWGKALKGIAKIGVAIAVAAVIGITGIEVAERAFGWENSYAKIAGVASVVGSSIGGVIDGATNLVTDTLGITDSQNISNAPLPDAPESVSLELNNEALAEASTKVNDAVTAFQENATALLEGISNHPGLADLGDVTEAKAALDASLAQLSATDLSNLASLTPSELAQRLTETITALGGIEQAQAYFEAVDEHIQTAINNGANPEAFASLSDQASAYRESLADASQSVGEIVTSIQPNQGTGLGTLAAGAGAAALTGAAAYGVGRRSGAQDGAKAVYGAMTQRIMEERQAQQLAALTQQGKGA